jgi:L-2-hydroxyglutarate oxidase LhgO
MTATVDKVECVVIGAGVVGLAIGRALALEGREVLVLESNPRIGAETSSRNNEVVHGGYLYPQNSLKARLCRPGREMMYAYCDRQGIRYQRLGKLLLALAEDELPMLDFRMEQGRINGVDDLVLMDGAAVRDMEPKIRCLGAVFSPSTGIVDSHALMLSYQGDIEGGGGSVVLNSRVMSGKLADSGFLLDLQVSGTSSYQLHCEMLVNSAGLGARPFALSLAGYPSERVPKIHFPKGSCYAHVGKSPFSHLVVTMGHTMASGAALTLDLSGQARWGPDVFEWPEVIDYDHGPDRTSSFGAAIRRFYPAFDESRIHPSYAAIRPRIAGPGAAMGDWMVDGPGDHGIANLVQLFGIESPGLTSSMALGDHVLDLLKAEPKRTASA